MSAARGLCVVLITCPAGPVAQRLAQRLIREHAAACVNIIARVDSYFWWQGKVDYAKERLLIVKTTFTAVTHIRQLLKRHHPYTVPELVALPIRAGLPAYLHWVRAS